MRLRRRAGLAFAILAAASPLVAAAATIEYPPAGYFQFGSAFIAGGNGTNTCGAFLVASQLLGTGGRNATVFFSQEISYEVEDQNNNFQTAEIGASAAMEFTSPSQGTITFDFLSQDVPKGDRPLSQPFPFTVKEAALQQGVFTMIYTIALPGCSLGVESVYRSLQ
jgi:hypothetical protein